MVTAIIASVLMGVVLVAVMWYLSANDWRQYTPNEDLETVRAGGISRVANSPLVWTLSFLILTVVLGGGVLLFLQGSAAQQATAGMVIGIATAVVIAGYVIIGTYRSARSYGFHNAQAAMLGAWAIGLLLVVAVSAALLVG